MLQFLNLVIFASALVLGSTSLAETAGKRVVCYYGSWAVYRYGAAKITPQDIDLGLCSHFIYTFVGLNENTAQVQILDPNTDTDDSTVPGGQIKYLREKARAVGTKMYVAVGGWGEGSPKYSNVIGNPITRQTFIDSIINFVVKYDLDGFDIDWEYPTQRGGVPTDRAAFSEFVSSLYKILKGMGKDLSAAVTANVLTIQSSYDVPFVCQNIDMINIMAYDLHGSWETTTGHHAALYSRPGDDPNLNVNAALKGWLDAGCNPQVLNLGIAAYGRSFTLNNPSQNGMGAPAWGTPPAGWTGESGFFGYDQICANNASGWSFGWDDIQKVPYTYKGTSWVGFDDLLSVRLKVCLAKTANIGGVMLWTVETDDFRGNCGQGKFPIIKTMISALSDASCGGSNPNIPTAAPPTATTTTTLAPQTTTTTLSPNLPTAAPPTATSTTTLAPVPTPEQPQAVPELPNTPVVPDPPSSDAVVCTAPGMVRDPRDCSSFFICGTAGDVPMRLTCPAGLQYDPSIGVCNYRSAVRCI